ncbi:Sphingomyelinase [Galdieria sulphuraria]|nr:Sphingomyelinase [Galdieria sulphuraria]
MLEWLIFLYLLSVGTRKFIVWIALFPSSLVFSLEYNPKICRWLGYVKTSSSRYFSCYSFSTFYLLCCILLFLSFCMFIWLRVLFPTSRHIKYLKLAEEATNSLPSVSSGPHIIRLMSYNAFCRPPGIAGDNGEDFKDERLSLLLKRIGYLDIVCFQELFDAFCNRREAFIEASKLLGFQYECFLPRNCFRIPPRIIDGGVTILSKFPILYTNYIHYRHCVYSTVDSFVGKGCLYARISLTPTCYTQKSSEDYNKNSKKEMRIERAQYLHVFSSHMQAGDRIGYPHESYHARIRIGQLEEMRDFIHWNIVDDDGPVVITGDWNINARTSMENDSDSFWYQDLLERLQDSPSSLYLLQQKRAQYFQDNTIRNLCLKDLLSLSHHGRHPITDGTKCIDYVLFDPRKGNLHGATEGTLKTFIEPFRVTQEEKKMYSLQLPNTLSDHYGVVATFVNDYAAK